MQQTSVDDFHNDLAADLARMSAEGTLKRERVLCSPQSAWVGVQRADGSRRDVLNLCANNYLGLSDDPRLAAAARDAIGTWGVGLSSVRFICGTQEIHRRLETRIAAWLGVEDAILLPSCFDANTGFFEVFFHAGDHIISDRLNHASIIDGVRLSKAERSVYDNGTLDQLEACLKAAAGARRIVVATDGVFSMDGVIAPLPGICDLAERYGAQVFVDDSHGLGVIGATGRGAIEHRGVQGRVQVISGTLGKAFGGAAGGFVAGRTCVIETLRQKCRPYLFSNAVAPALVAAALAAFDVLDAEPERLARLQSGARYLREGLGALGYRLAGADHPIVPVMIGDAAATAALSEQLLQKRLYAVAFSHPVVPRGEARIRLQVSAAHDQSDLDRAIAIFAEAGRDLGLIGRAA